MVGILLLALIVSPPAVSQPKEKNEQGVQEKLKADLAALVADGKGESPEAEALRSRISEAECALALERTEYLKADECFEQVIRRDPKNGAAWRGRAIAKSHGGDAEAAEEAFQVAISLEPEDPLTRKAADAWTRRRGLEPIRAGKVELPDWTKAGGGALGHGRAASPIGSDRFAAGLLRGGAAGGGESGKLAAQAYDLHKLDPGKALRLADKAVDSDPRDVNARFVRAILREKTGDADGALEDVGVLKKEAPDVPEVYELAAKAYERKGLNDQAASERRQTGAADPSRGTRPPSPDGGSEPESPGIPLPIAGAGLVVAGGLVWHVLRKKVVGEQLEELKWGLIAGGATVALIGGYLAWTYLPATAPIGGISGGGAALELAPAAATATGGAAVAAGAKAIVESKVDLAPSFAVSDREEDRSGRRSVEKKKRTTSSFERAVKELRLDRHKASEVLHEIKRAAGRGGKANVEFDLETGDVISPETGEIIGNLIP